MDGRPLGCRARGFCSPVRARADLSRCLHSELVPEMPDRAISDLEVVYDEHKGHLWEIRYPVIDDAGKETGEFLTIATTRPETMLGDVAVADPSSG